jgi:hypothetical protein
MAVASRVRRLRLRPSFSLLLPLLLLLPQSLALPLLHDPLLELMQLLERLVLLELGLKPETWLWLAGCWVGAGSSPGATCRRLALAFGRPSLCPALDPVAMAAAVASPFASVAKAAWASPASPSCC